VASLQLQNLRTNERLSASAEKNKDLSAESQRIQLHNQMLMKCVGELTAITKRKEGTIEQLRHCIQNAEKLTDIPLPPTEQVLLLCTLFLISTGKLFGAHRLHCYRARSSLSVLVYCLEHTGLRENAQTRAFAVLVAFQVLRMLHMTSDTCCCGLTVPNSSNNMQAQHLEDFVLLFSVLVPVCEYVILLEYKTVVLQACSVSNIRPYAWRALT